MVYLAVQLPDSMGSAVMTYPMGEIKPSQQKVSFLFGYSPKTVCVDGKDVEVFHSDDPSQHAQGPCGASGPVTEYFYILRQWGVTPRER